MVKRFVGRQGTFGLVLAPTREIAQQTQATFETFGAPRGVRSIVLIGGINMRHRRCSAMASYPQVIVATPGRLCDHLDRGNIWLDFIRDGGARRGRSDARHGLRRSAFAHHAGRAFQPADDAFLGDVPAAGRKARPQDSSMTRADRRSASPCRRQRRSSSACIWVSEERKNRELHRLLREEKGSIIVFTRSKEGATRVWRSLHSSGFYDATYIHSDRLQSHREQALAEFKEGKYRILIATDVAARGIHVDDVAHVINYDLPMEPEDYIHRIGRTGRAGATGKATTFVTPRDRGILKQIEKLIGFRIGSANVAPPADATGEAPAEVSASDGPKVPERVAPRSARGSRSEERTGKGRPKKRRGRDRSEEREGQQDWKEGGVQVPVQVPVQEPASQVEAPEASLISPFRRKITIRGIRAS